MSRRLSPVKAREKFGFVADEKPPTKKPRPRMTSVATYEATKPGSFNMTPWLEPYEPSAGQRTENYAVERYRRSNSREETHDDCIYQAPCGNWCCLDPSIDHRLHTCADSDCTVCHGKERFVKQPATPQAEGVR